MMEDRLGDLLHCEELLRNKLHSNDKEKLRQKLQLLQREHHRTFQRLRRAEHLDSVRGHIRSNNSHDQTKARAKPSAVEGSGTRGSLPGTAQKQQLSPGVATAVDNIPEKKTQASGASRLSDTAYTPTSNSSQDSAHVPKASPALRLRSRRSRIRLATRGVQSDHSSANSQETPRETEKTTGEQENNNTLFLNNATIAHESEELFSPSENDSPCLLLPHWNSQGQVEKEETRNQPRSPGSGKDRAESLVGIPDANGRILARRLEVSAKTTDHVHEKDENKTSSKVEPKQEDDQRLLDSCTLVEGLLFPAEYYVRTTRRMAVSRSQPDMNAIILSHLSRGRPRRGRGRGRRLNRTVSVDGGPVLEGFKDASQDNSVCEVASGVLCSLDGGSASAGPGRGRRGRGRGRGRRGRTPRHKARPTENANDAQVEEISLALSPPEFGVTCEEAPPEDIMTEDSCAAVSGVTRTKQVQTLNGHSSPPGIPQNHHRRVNGLHKNTEDWPSLLLPSSSQSDLPLRSPLPPLPLLKTLLDIQDFHLPDDQFASLKLLKLRQISADVEQFTPNNRPTHNHRTFSPQLIPMSLSPTPEISKTYSKPDFYPHNAKILDAKERENKDGEFDVLSQENLENFNLLSMQEDKIRPNCGNQPESKIPDVESAALEKKANVRCDMVSLESEVQMKNKMAASVDSSPENVSVRLSDCFKVESNTVDKGNQYIQSESRVLPKTIESSLKNCDEADSENILNVENKCKLEREALDHTHRQTQLLLSPSLESASCPLTLPHIGYTPQTVTAPCTPPALMDLSPPALSPCPASPLRGRPPSLPLASPFHPSQHLCEAPSEPAEGETQLGATVQGNDDEAKSCTYTVKTPAGGSLVDVCCVSSSSGSVWMAAAGTWAVCLWRSQSYASDWSLCHTWSFQEPVISVFPVPDAPDLLCVTLGQLEIREIRVLSCSTLSQSVLCDCVVQMAMGAPHSRVVCSSHTSTTSIIRVFTLSDHPSAPHCLPLVSQGGSLSSLAFVEGLPDALIGIDESRSLLIWNMKTGHLLQKVTLGDGFSHSVCLRGHSHSGALFALMQLHSLDSVKDVDEGPEAEERGSALFSLLAINPRNGKSILVAHFCPSNNWSGRLCEADVLGCRLAALSHRGSVCVWDLERPTDPPWAVGVPEGEGWQLARWGGRDILLTAQATGDVTLHYNTRNNRTPPSQN